MILLLVNMEKALGCKMVIENTHNIYDTELLILVLDSESIQDSETLTRIQVTYQDTLNLLKAGEPIVVTTIPQFLSFEYAKNLTVWYKGEEHDLTLGSCEGTDKEIRFAHNLQKILFAGGFSWFPKE